ncbi:FAD-binding protein [Streptomyces sp. AJS327]|uniref:FAD-dependent monooxygenase n=1 Tax=Streptomyces sp. AJS327 TaxID=2545265 RepID=UPI0015DDC9A6|nr:FAD-dependent monooxygenase [Streptomyces sp. AJS327]MBA0050980.1 FAD-binding protein [Streptomyces sp. AJS327]
MGIPHETDVLIVGSGPAGALLGYLLARRGVDVLVVEKQADFEREFRGESLAAPSVITLRKLGFGEDLDHHGYLESSGVGMWLEGRRVFHVDYRRFSIGTLPIEFPQPPLIRAFQRRAASLPHHHFVGGTRFTGLLEEDGRVRGAVLRPPGGTPVTVRARLVVGADGRFSKVRKAAGLAPRTDQSARDLLSFRLPRPDGWPLESELVVRRDQHLAVLPTYPDAIRVSHNLPKRGLGALRARGLESFRERVVTIDPRLAPLVERHLRSWDDTGFLEVFNAELDEWARDGVLLIGDASHTATPTLGQGVNLAIQDVVGVAPLIASALANGAGGPSVPATAFGEFIAERRRHKAFVARFQKRQEASLAMRSGWQVAARRARFRMLHALPLKYGVFDRLLNTPHRVHPDDLP